MVQTLGARHPELPRAELIRIAYDLQAGSYTSALSRPEVIESKRHLAARVAELLCGLPIQSALEAGCGEATSLTGLMQALPPCSWWAFDLSLSRLLHARSHLAAQGLRPQLFAGDMRQIPMASSSVDLVLTVHALEPNGGEEASLLAELHRVSARYLLLVEPDYEAAGEAQRARMTAHRYVRDLQGQLSRLPGRLLRHEPLGGDINPLNAAGITLFDKGPGAPAQPAFAAPGGSGPLQAMGGGWFCPEQGRVWPEVAGLPCLLPESGLIATHLPHFCSPRAGAPPDPEVAR